MGVGTAVPNTSYTQQEILDEFAVVDPRVRSVFLNSAIERRGLTLPPLLPNGTRGTETQGELLQKHLTHGLSMGREALEACLKDANANLDDIRYLCCVTTTGMLTPGFSALLIKELGMDRHCARLDVVGMGCNAGLNALTAVTSWAKAHPGELALMVCVEVCSAAYVFDGTMRTSVVNSLFGDGAAALAVRAPASRPPVGEQGRKVAEPPRAPSPRNFSGFPASSFRKRSMPCVSTGTTRTESTASSSTRKCLTWWAHTPRSRLADSSKGQVCDVLTYPTGWFIPAGRRSSTRCGSISA